MPARAPKVSRNLEKVLQGLGQKIRDRRKELKISSITTAEAAGISRVTLHRVEKGEGSVAMSSYLSVIAALGLSIELAELSKGKKSGSPGAVLPKKIRLTDYKQLKRIAWQLKGTKEISPNEALDLYERNWRHVDAKAMDERERKLLEMLMAFFGRGRLLV